MKQESKRGGKREGAGRKPTGRIKKPITAYIEENIISDKGGIDAVRSIMVNAVYDDRANSFINAARGRDESGINEDEIKTAGKGRNRPNRDNKNTATANGSKNKATVGAENVLRHRLWRDGDPQENTFKFVQRFGGANYDDKDFKR